MALIRAIALKDFRATALSTTDVSTGYNLGGLSTGQSVYAALHLTSAYNNTGRVLSMAVQSASSSGFTGAATRITFTLSTTESGAWGTPATNFSTDHVWWRASWTMSTTASTGGTWKGLVEMGIR